MGFQTEENEHNLSTGLPLFSLPYYRCKVTAAQSPTALLSPLRLYPLTEINPPLLLWLDVLSQQLENEQLQALDQSDG